LEVLHGTGPAYSVAPPNSERCYLGSGTAVTVVDLGVLNAVGVWDAGGPVRGLAVSRDGARLLIGYPGAVGWRSTDDGKALGRVPVAGLTQLRRTL
jgi:hypothetical protein